MRVRMVLSADVVELVDSLDLGSNARACRFESCHPHQNKKYPFGVLFILVCITDGLEPISMQHPGGVLLKSGWTDFTPYISA